MVTGIDQVGLPIALERGFFEKHGPRRDHRAALRDRRRRAQRAAGRRERDRAGGRADDRRRAARHGPGRARQLQRQRHQARLGRDDGAHRPRGLRHRQGRPGEPQGQEDRRLVRHHQPPLRAGAAREGRAHAGRRHARQHAAARHDGRAARQGHRRVLGLGPVADRRAEGRARRRRGDPRRRRDLLSRLQRRDAALGGEERRDDREVPRRRLRGRQVDARQPEAGRAGRDALDPGPEAGRRRGRDAVQHPAERPAALGQQLPRALVARRTG